MTFGLVSGWQNPKAVNQSSRQHARYTSTHHFLEKLAQAGKAQHHSCSSLDSLRSLSQGQVQIMKT